MTTHKRTGLAFAMPALCLALAISACDDDSTGPISPTPTPPFSPHPPTPTAGAFVVSGVVSELKVTGPVPVADAVVEVAVCPPEGGGADAVVKSVTDAAGAYQVSGMCAGTTYLWVSKEGYRANRKDAPQCDGDCVYVYIAKDTRFDIELVRE